MGLKSRFSFKVLVLYASCFADIVMNSFGDHRDFSNDTFVPYMIVGAQFLLQLLNCITLFMLLSETYVFQVGLLMELSRFFLLRVLAILSYTLIYTAYAGVKIVSVVRSVRRRP